MNGRLGAARCAVLEQGVQRALPQHEARLGTDMATTLTSLKDESSDPRIDEQRNQLGAGDMHVGANPLAFELDCLRWSGASEQRERYPSKADRGELRGIFIRVE